MFLLVAENEEEIITTIRSRCQLVKVPGIRPDILGEALARNPGTAGKNSGNLVHLIRGNYRKALKLAETAGDGKDNLTRFKELMRLSYGRKFLDLFKWVDDISGIGREKQKSFLQYALIQTRENFVYNLRQPELVFLDEEETAFSSRFSPYINERNVVPVAGELEKACVHIAMNGNPRIIFTDMVLKIVKLIRK